MPLKVIVVGAGIAGLCAAVSLRQAGHSVEIFEKSKFATEVGAALSLSPNGVRVLRSLGFDFERARARQMMVWESVDGTTLELISSLDFEHAEEQYGAPFMAVHRVDLHKELYRLALDEEGGDGQGTGKLHLASPVVNARTDQGVIELADGSVHEADLIVAADGLHSVVRSSALQKEAKPKPSGLSAFRFLASTKVLEDQNDPEIAKLMKWKAPGATILADTADLDNERHMVWYDCQGGDVQNFVGIHPTRSEDEEEIKASMMKEFDHFDSGILKIINLAEEVKVWPLFIHDPMPSWTYGKIVLIGDAAHPMLPFGGQGSNQAIEDGGALGYLLKGVDAPTGVSGRLALFDQVRRNRASRVQTLSKVRVGKEKEVEQELKKYTDTPDATVPGSFPERISHDFGFNVFGKCDEVLASA